MDDDNAEVVSLPQAPDAIELRHLRAFVAVADELNFGRAAARLYLSQPALSRQIRSLERLVGCDLLRRSTHRVELTLAGEALLEGVHSARHVERIRELSMAGGGAVDADTFVGEASYRAALHAAGGACEMVRALIARESMLGFCGVRPPGHHAEPDRAMGFCIFNNVALAAEHAIRDLGAQRVFILDWDVHHGNGTAAAFRTRSDVLFASIHQWGIYPGTGAFEDVGSGAGEGFTINLPVPGGSEGELWLSLVEQIALPAAEAFAPDLVLVSAGFDAHRMDPLAGCELETSSFAELARHVRDLAARLDVPLGVVLEGGYEPITLGECVRETLAALGSSQAARSASAESAMSTRAREHLARYWPL